MASSYRLEPVWDLLVDHVFHHLPNRRTQIWFIRIPVLQATVIPRYFYGFEDNWDTARHQCHIWCLVVASISRLEVRKPNFRHLRSQDRLKNVAHDLGSSPGRTTSLESRIYKRSKVEALASKLNNVRPERLGDLTIFCFSSSNLPESGPNDEMGWKWEMVRPTPE